MRGTGEIRNALTGGAARLEAWLARFLEREGETLLYWGTVLFGAGIGLYFLFPFEPPLFAPVLAALVMFAASALAAKSLAFTLLTRALAIMAAGMAVAAFRTADLATETLGRETGPAALEGRLQVVEDRVEGGLRLTIENVPAPLPATVRITVRTDYPELAPGMTVRTRAILLPLPEPVIPGGYDFGRQLWFDGIGAVGFAVAPVEVTALPAVLTFSERVRALRERIAARIREVVPGAAGGVSAALVTGIRDGIPEAVNENMRIAGLAHLLAISGLHMALVTGILFFAIRAVLALIPRIALQYPVKKIAAGAAFAGAMVYLFLSGMSVSTIRAFIMVGIVLLAVVMDREPISLRLVSVAALVILVLTPEALLHPSFQMSFAAVIGLVAAYRAFWPQFARLGGGPEGGWVAKLRLYVLGIILSTLIAEVSIAPVAYYHFGRFSTFAVLANITAVPATGLWVMPLGLLGLLFYPLGLDAVFWKGMAAGVTVILETARGVAQLPGADFLLPAMPLAAFVLFVTAGLWLCLWRGRGMKRLGVLPLALGVGIYIADDAPDIVTDREGRLAAIRGPDGLYYFSSLNAARFSRENWQQHFGQKRALHFRDYPSHNPASLRCDPLGCVWRREDGVVVAFSHAPAALAEDCRRADLIVTPDYAPFWCKDARPVIDRAAARRGGAHAVWLEEGTVRIESVAAARGRRPWTRSDGD